MRRHTLLGIALLLPLAACRAEPPADSPSIEWAQRWPSPPPPPPPPPGAHDAELQKLPQPLSPKDAQRVLVEATIFAPMGFGLGGRPMQALAINTLLEQPDPSASFEAVYRRADVPGRLLALCGLRTANPATFATLARPLETSSSEVPIYEGCIGWRKTAAELVSEIRTSSLCTDIPRSKERISAECKPAG